MDARTAFKKVSSMTGKKETMLLCLDRVLCYCSLVNVAKKSTLEMKSVSIYRMVVIVWAIHG